MPALRAGAPARVVNVSSMGHWIFTPPGGILFDDFRGEGAKAVVNPWSRYSSSKLANVLHAFEINRRFGGAASNGVVGVSLHPGAILSTRLGDTAFGSVSTILTMLSYGFPLVAPIVDPLKSIAAGAATSVFCAIAPFEARAGDGGVRPGGYHQDSAVATVRVSPFAADAGLAARLWDATEKIIGEVLASPKQ